MSKKDTKQDINNEPEQLEDKELDQVNGGYTEVEWTYVTSKTKPKRSKISTTKEVSKEVEGVASSAGDGRI